ncbi:protein Aster-C-like [Brevipalpus obovatus]|uniref:protein Aster-C-like n=1 Tax=Brevipalpus obovatus TaxID=246614 RepID=UPI003D9FA784
MNSDQNCIATVPDRETSSTINLFTLGTSPSQSSSSESLSSANQPTLILRENMVFKAPLSKFFKSSKDKSQLFSEKFFTTIGADETVLFDCSCALVKDFLVRGRLYLTQNYLCFHGRILKFSKTVVINFADILNIRKRKKMGFSVMEVSIHGGQKYLLTFFSASRKDIHSTIKWAWINASHSDQVHNIAHDESQNIKKTKICPPTITLSTSLNSEEDSSSQNKSYPLPKKSATEIFGLHGVDSNCASSSDSKGLSKKITKNSGKKSSSAGDLDYDRKSNCILPSSSSAETDSPSTCTNCTSRCCYTGNGNHGGDFKIPFNVDKLFELLYVNYDCWDDFNAKHNLCMRRRGVWRKSGPQQLTNYGALETIGLREQEVGLKITFPFEKTIVTHDSQYIINFESNQYYHVKHVVQVEHGAPFASLFYTITSICLSKGASDSESIVHFHFETVFVKRSWGMQSFIHDSSFKVSREMWAHRWRAVQEICEGKPEYYSKPGVHESLSIFLEESSYISMNPENQSAQVDGIYQKTSSKHSQDELQTPSLRNRVQNTHDSHTNRAEATFSPICDRQSNSNEVESRQMIFFSGKFVLVWLFFSFLLNLALFLRLRWLDAPFVMFSCSFMSETPISCLNSLPNSTD